MDDPDGGRILVVTHKRPHLDEVVSIWLLTTFDSAYQNCTYDFILYFGQAPAGDHVVTIGIGGGKYDEHKMSVATSATRLVFDDLVQRGLIPNATHHLEAVRALVDYSDAEDRAIGYGQDEDLRPFLVQNLIRGHREKSGSDADELRLGLEIVEAIMVGLNKRAIFLDEWKNRIEFETPWGKGIGIDSDYGRSDTYAYAAGYVLRVGRHRTEPVISIKALPTSEVDLTAAYEKAIALEPTSWYLHQSKKMLISAIDPATGRTPSNLSLTQLIELVKS